MICHAIITLSPGNYAHPIDLTKSLFNSLYYLCHDSIPRRIAEHIPHPDKLSLNEFYAKVRSLGFVYSLGRPRGSDESARARVDVTKEVENLPLRPFGIRWRR